MVNGGWVKLYRELKSKSIWQLSTPQQKVVLITILLLANHEENKWEWKGEQFVCKPGQLITSLNSLVMECGEGVTIRNVRTALERFEKLGFLTNTSTKTGRLITIVNWEKYQGRDYVSDKGADKDLTKSRQRPDKDLTTNKNDKEYKNDKEIYMCAFDDLWNVYPRKKEKAKAYECYRARVQEGFSEDELLLAVKRYAEECKTKNIEERYIKHAATFLGDKKPFQEYLGDYKPCSSKGTNKFNNFESRKYDMSSLESKLLGR